MKDLLIGSKFLFSLQGVTQSQVNVFGDLLGTNGKIHTDPEWASKTPLRGVIVQGGLLMAPLHEAMCDIVGGQNWTRSGEVEIKIVSFTRPEESVLLEIVVDKVSTERAEFSLSWSKTEGTKVLVGTAQVDFQD